MMKKYRYLIYLSLGFFAYLLPQFASGQVINADKQVISIPDAIGFDVIILTNGDLLYGLVKEVNATEVKYKRTDIPDGPIYVIDKKKVYAISYRNQVKDILNPIGDSWNNGKLKDSISPQAPVIINKMPPKQYGENYILAGVGFIRGFTDVENAKDYSSRSSFPVITLAYEMQRRNNLRLGLQLATGARKFTRQEYSSYDSAQKNIEIKENIFTLHVYAKYMPLGPYGSFQPYLSGGLGLQYSDTKSEFILNFINNSIPSVLAKSGGRSVRLGVLLRAGLEYTVTDWLKIMADAGIGPAVIQAGMVFNIGNLK